MRIIVGNLPRDTTTVHLDRLFGTYGTASVSLETEWDDYEDDEEEGGLEIGGAAYVFMPDVAQAYAAIKALDGWHFHGNNLSVTEVEPEAHIDVVIAGLTVGSLIVAFIVLVATNYFLWFLH